MLALREMLLNFGQKFGGNIAVEEVSEFGEEVCAGHRDVLVIRVAGARVGFFLK